MIIIDYIKKIKPEVRGKEIWMGGGEVMEEIESDIAPEDLNCACIALNQAQRGAYDDEFVKSSKSGGDIGIVETAHAVVTGNRSPDQKYEGLANISIEHSRFGDDGIELEDIIFNNGRVFIDSGPAEDPQFRVKNPQYYKELDKNKI